MNSSRNWTLDLLRGFTILLMTLAHTIFFLHSHSHPLLNALNYLGDLYSFGALLFVSSAVGYLSYLRLGQPAAGLIRHLAKRLLLYLGGYYLLAFAMDWLSHGFHLHRLTAILTFQHLVPFTEFLIALLILGFFKFITPRLQHRLSQSLTLSLTAGLVFYLIGMLIYLFLNTPHLPSAWQAIIAGYPGFYSFPVLQYLPIYFLGLHAGHIFYQHTSASGQIRSFFRIIIVFLAISVIASATLPAFSLPIDQLFYRWPPTLLFLSAGLILCLLTLIAFIKFQNLVNFPWTRNALLLIGQNAFSIFITHTLTVSVLNQIFGNSVDSLYLLFSVWVITVITSIYLAKILPLNMKFNLTLYRWCECQLGACTHAQEHHLVLKTKSLLLKLFSLSRIFSIRVGDRRYSLLRKRHFALGFFLILLSATALGVADNYQLVINELESSSGQLNRTWILTTDTSQPLVYTLELPSDIQPQSLVAHLTQSNNIIQTGIMNNGKCQASNPENLCWQATFSPAKLTPGSYQVYSQANLQILSPQTKPITFYVSAPLYVTWTLDWEGYDVSDRNLSSISAVADSYRIPITHMFSPRIYVTSSQPPVEQPVPTPDAATDSAQPQPAYPLASLVRDVTDPARAQHLTDWVIRRRDLHHDEIGLHLHMFPDLVADAGLTPKLEPAWGGAFTHGYDILTSAYTYEEMLQILSRTKYWFQTKKLGVPKSFRAGAWYAEEHTLRALQDSGFLVDSSGRTAYYFGSRHLPGPWQLSETTPPYYPSFINQNLPAVPPDLSDNFPSTRENSLDQTQLILMEIPNNGADSYAFTPEQMIQRFQANYSGTPLDTPTQVTFLSHPQWFDKEKRISAVFDYLKSHLYINNSGPAVYTTLLGVYEAFK